ncbi:hypothetical protein DPMN_043504 [Dreissena polymorpha]|uniref:Uncharacterized protein n=1 Tax=Dreissena polymorpha TaxID=45954 RepID=A0A9D4HY03_DREPO|nr:hypothetical protein DPMN_043504 [Dreissena polymorpha]
MWMSKLALYSPQLDIREICRMSLSELARHSLFLDIQDKCRMAMPELAKYSPSSIIGTFAECRCQS